MRLVEAGLLEGRGARRNRTYHLSAEVYRELGKPAAYIRRRGFERPQMEQMILQFVETYGAIARRDVMDLCRIDRNQASYLLSQLVEEGHLQLVGKGRGAHYVAGETEERTSKH